MLKKCFIFALCWPLLFACATREIDIFDDKGKVVGGCIAGYDWHLYGLQDSIDYMLYKCAKSSISAGYSLSDTSLLTKDFSLPLPPKGQRWNKKLAMQQFHQGYISETKLGYILAEIEYLYLITMRQARQALADGKIDQARFENISKQAKYHWLGE